MTSEPVYSISSAAELTGYSLPTIRKRLDDLRKHGAVQVEGRWRIPLSALHQAGLMVKVTTNPDRKVVADSLDSATTNEIATLRAELADALQRAAVAEAVAAERGQALERADVALRMIEAGRTGAGSSRTGWLGRRRG